MFYSTPHPHFFFFWIFSFGCSGFFVAACRLSLVGVIREGGYSVVLGPEFLIVMASLVVEHRL